MDPITMGLLGGSALGLVKGGILDADKEKRQRKQEAEIARYSPWTGMKAQAVQSADPLGSAMQGATTGGMLGSGIQAGMKPEAAAAVPGAANIGQASNVGQYGTPLSPEYMQANGMAPGSAAQMQQDPSLWNSWVAMTNNRQYQ